MSAWARRRAQRIHLDEVEKFVDRAHQQVVSQEQRVNALVAWLEARRIENGFGEDLEWTFLNPRVRRGGRG